MKKLLSLLALLTLTVGMYAQKNWESMLNGTWTCITDKSSAELTENVNGSKKKGTVERQDSLVFTFDNGTATYTCKSNEVKTYQDGSTKDKSYIYTIRFTYKYVAEGHEFTSKAHLKGKVTESDNTSYWKVGDTFYVNLYSLDKNIAEISSGKDSFINRKEFTKQ